MPGIDEESVSALKEAKTKEVFFALVVKNANVGAMLVNKTGKVPTKLIDKAKEDCETRTTVIGRCSAKNGLLTVKTVKPVDTNGETLTKKLVKEAGFTHCAFTTDKDAENDPSTKPGSQGTSGTQGVKDDRAAGLKKRLDVIEQWCKANQDGIGTKDTVDRAVLVVEQVNEALKANNLVEAEKKLLLIENYLNPSKPGSTTTPSGTTSSGTVRGPQQPQPTGGGKTEELRKRLGVIVHWCSENKEDPGNKETVERAIPVVQQADQFLKRGNLVEAEKKLVTLEKYLKLGSSPTTPTTPPTPPPTRPTTPVPVKNTKQNLDQAKLGLDGFTQNPGAGFTSPQAKQSIQTAKSNLLNLITSERGKEDDISRKGIIFDSKDASYKKNVTDVVDKLTYDIEGVMSDPTKNSTGAIKQVSDTIGLLAVQRAHYADMRGITDEKMLDQRKRKVAAIDKHVEELKKISAELRKVLQLKMKPVMDFTKSLAALEKDDPEGAKTAVQEFVKTLSENKQMRQDLFQSAGPEDCEALMTLLRERPDVKDDGIKSPEELEEEDWSKDLAKSRADDPQFMDTMCKTAIMTETADIKSKGTFFRGTSPAVKLAATYVRNSPAGKAYCQMALNRYGELSKGKGDLEVKSTTDGGTVSPKDAQKNMETHKAMLNDLIDGISENPDGVPPEIAKICNTFTEAAQKVDPSDQDFVTTQSGGFLMLRVLVPTLTDDSTKQINAITRPYEQLKREEKQKWIKSGKDVKQFTPPEMSRSDRQQMEKLQEKQKLANMQSKILQNMSNGTEFKEPHMQPMNSLIKSQGKFTGPTAKLRTFLKKVADRGKG